jgi:electron transfer flavoprotein alpha subunit
VSVLVIVETREGSAHPGSIECLAAARLMGSSVSVVVPGHGVDAACRELQRFDVKEIVALDHPALTAYTADGFVTALAAYIRDAHPDWVVAPHTYRSRDFMPALATRLERGLVSDCTAVGQAGQAITFTRAMFRGKLAAEVVLDGPPPGFVTFQVGAIHASGAGKTAAEVPITTIPAAVDPSTIRQVAEPPFREARQAVDLAKAGRIVAVGRGIKGEEHLGLARSLAEALGAELAASRPICDAGWLPMDRQIGSSGQTVAPRLYVAIGISGAIQHIVGMKGAQTIVAVNKDPEAPIFEVADYGIVGDLFDVVPAMVAALKG